MKSNRNRILSGILAVTAFSIAVPLLGALQDRKPDRGPWFVVVEGSEGVAPYIDGPWLSLSDAERNASLYRQDRKRVLGVMTSGEFNRRVER